MMLALTAVKLYFPNSFPLLQVKPFILPTVLLAADKTLRIMVLPLVLLANSDCAIDKTWSSSNSNIINI